MEKIKGYIVNEFPYKDLKKVSDLQFFEGPILSHYKDSENRDILFYWVDFDLTFNRWLVFSVNEEELYRYLKGKLSLKNLLDSKKSDFVFTVDIDSELAYKNIHIISQEELHPKYIPEEKSYYENELSQLYTELDKKYESSLHLANLREKAVYLKISPNVEESRKYSGTVEADDAIEFLKNITSSYINYVGSEFEKRFKFQYSIDTLPKLVKKLKEELRPRIVDLRYSSFSVAISPDTTMEKNSVKGDKVEKWKENVIKDYKHDVFDINYNDQNEVQKIIEKFTVAERKKIFEPIFNILNNDHIVLSVSEQEDHSFKRYHSIPKEVTDKILIDPNPVTPKEVEEPSVFLAKVKVSNKSKTRGDILDLFDNYKINSTWDLPLIKGKDRDYELKHTLSCRYSKDGDYITLENETLGIFAFGKTDQEAEDMFSEEFEFIYERYNSLNNDQLSDDVIFIKDFLNLIVKK